MDPDMLTRVGRETLVDLLIHGDNVPANIADNIDRHSTSVSRRLSDLEDEGLVENKGRGVWTLTPQGVRVAQSVSNHD